MKKLYLISIFITLNIVLSFGQKINEYYICVPSDSASDCRLKFLSDSTVELSNVPRHMRGMFKIVFKYINKIDKIEISTEALTPQDSVTLSKFKLNFYIKPLINLTKIEGGYIDSFNSFIYVKEKDFEKKKFLLTFIVDGKTYIEHISETNSYGIVTKSHELSKKLQKELDIIGKNPDKYKIEIVKGWKAYQRFGIQTVYGVFLINRK